VHVTTTLQVEDVIVKRPFVQINVAMTADGKIDTVARKGATISSAADRARVDALRAESDAVMVGGKTLLAEDPDLTVRSVELRQARLARGAAENPAQVAVVTLAEIRPDGQFMTRGPARRIIYTTARTAAEQIARLEAAGAEVFTLGEARVDMARALASLQALGVQRLMVEGGGTLIAELLRLDLADELTLYLAPRIFGGASAPTLADGPGFALADAPRLELVSHLGLGADGGLLLHYRVAHKE
jgi:2,5-diamino-6-(ribosylamino)-4(3H)-pyrimidinone 5'-phosphate reductase